VSISHPELNKDIFHTFIKSNLFYESFLNNIYEVSQSNRTFLLDGEFNVTIRIVKSISGSGIFSKRLNPPETQESSSKRKTCVIVINNKDKSCGYQAIALGIFIKENDLKLKNI
jgi:hypothetical protein